MCKMMLSSSNLGTTAPTLIPDETSELYVLTKVSTQSGNKIKSSSMKKTRSPLDWDKPMFRLLGVP